MKVKRGEKDRRKYVELVDKIMRGEIRDASTLQERLGRSGEAG